MIQVRDNTVYHAHQYTGDYDDPVVRQLLSQSGDLYGDPNNLKSEGWQMDDMVPLGSWLIWRDDFPKDVMIYVKSSFERDFVEVQHNGD